MKVIIFGASGMVGQGVLLECLKDPSITQVLIVGRSALGRNHEKLKEILHKDFTDFSLLSGPFTGFDACLFCLGVSSLGMTEADYAHITYDFTLAAAKVLARVSPGASFLYVSGEGTDSTEQGKMMWARVKGKTENDVMKLFPGKGFAIRPGMILPRDGILPKNKWLKVLLMLLYPLFALMRLIPTLATDTRTLGRAMIRAAQGKAPKQVLVTRDLNQLGAKRN